MDIFLRFLSVYSLKWWKPTENWLDEQTSSLQLVIKTSPCVLLLRLYIEKPFKLYPRHDTVAHSLTQRGCLNHWQIQHVCRMLGALCVSWWTCLNRMRLLTNGVTKNQPTRIQWAWKTHIKVERGKRQDRWRKMGDRSLEFKTIKKTLTCLWWDFKETTWRCKNKKKKEQRWFENRMKAKKKLKKESEWKNRSRSNRRQERLGDIFSSSLVRDVLYSAGWSLRWGPLEIIMTACCFRQPHTFHWKTIYKLPLLYPAALMSLQNNPQVLARGLKTKLWTK